MVYAASGFLPESVYDSMPPKKEAHPKTIYLDHDKLIRLVKQREANSSPDDRLIDALTSSLNSINPRYRYVVEKVYVEGKTLREIAAEMHISHTRVAEIRDEALGRLRTKIRAVC